MKETVPCLFCLGLYIALSAFFKSSSGVLPSFGIGGNPNARLDCERYSFDFACCYNRVPYLLDDVFNMVFILNVEYQVNEFVPALTAHGIIRPHGGLKSLSDRSQNLVSNLMAVGVVDFLKIVQIDEQQTQA